MKFKVTVYLRNAGGDVTPMQWLKEGTEFDAAYSVMSVLRMDDDRPWAELVSIHVDRIEESRPFTKEEIERFN